MSTMTEITPADARTRFGSRCMTPDGLVWKGNVCLAYIGGVCWSL